MKNKKYLVLSLLPLLTLNSCAFFASLKNNNENNSDNNVENTNNQNASNQNQDNIIDDTHLEIKELTYDIFIKAYEKTKNLDNVTIYCTHTETYESHANDFGLNVPCYRETIDVTTYQRDGNKIISTEGFEDNFYVTISEACKELGISEDVYTAYFLKEKYNLMEYDRQVNEHFSNWDLGLANNRSSCLYECHEPDYSFYLVEDKQWIGLGYDFEATYWPNGFDNYIYYLDDMIEDMDNPSVSGNTISFNVGEIDCQMQVDFNGELISSIVITFFTGEEHVIRADFTKFGETSITSFPEYTLKECVYGNHEGDHLDYSYYGNEKGHQKYCKECGKYVGEFGEHDFSNNNYEYCEICGYLNNKKYRVPDGFNYGLNNYFRVNGSDKAFNEIYYNTYGLTYSLSDSLENGNIEYWYFGDKNSILKIFEGEKLNLVVLALDQ